MPRTVKETMEDTMKEAKRYGAQAFHRWLLDAGHLDRKSEDDLALIDRFMESDPEFERTP